jgi:hypothetical protein
MSEIERERVKSLIEGMSPEVMKQVIAVLPSEMLFQELMIRDKANREILERVKMLVE